jgi:uncharacterized membrane protein
MNVLRIVALIALASTACNPATEIGEVPCPPNGTTLRYEEFGKSFLDAHCQTCHAAAGTHRRGAPSGYDFHDRDAVLRHKDRIFARAAADNTSMPPGPDDPPEPDRAKLAEWLACGAP